MTTGTKARFAAVPAWAPSAVLLAAGGVLVTPAAGLRAESKR